MPQTVIIGCSSPWSLRNTGCRALPTPSRWAQKILTYPGEKPLGSKPAIIMPRLLIPEPADPLPRAVAPSTSPLVCTLTLGGLSEGFVSENFAHRLGTLCKGGCNVALMRMGSSVSFKFKNETHCTLVGGRRGQQLRLFGQSERFGVLARGLLTEIKPVS